MRKTLFLVLTGMLVWVEAAMALPDAAPEASTLVERPYLELLEIAPSLNVPEEQIKALRKQLNQEEKAEKKRLKNQVKALKSEVKAAKAALSKLNRSPSQDDAEAALQRNDLQCRILGLEKEIAQKRTEQKQGLPTAFDNREAKLDLIRQWPLQKAQIEERIASGKARERRFGDVEDIGFRTLSEGQEKDIRTVEESIRQMRTYGFMPPKVEDPEVTGYVQELAERIAAASDLDVPLHVTVLDSDEINAFALPGGFLFVNQGLVEKARSESELGGGVIAHEIAHSAARHGHRMMKRAHIFDLLYQAAQIAAMVMTGGAVASLAGYCALQYGFMGLGMVLNLTMLGVSRDFELEADHLAVQYLWNSGYDPKGFISFFDLMATEKGYVNSASFFRTHPPFFERILDSFAEIAYLPERDTLMVDSGESQDLKTHLQQRAAERKQTPRTRRDLGCGGPTARDVVRITPTANSHSGQPVPSTDGGAGSTG